MIKNRKEGLDQKLEIYANSGYYPFHMPGHKRSPLLMPNPYTIDITEIEGFDNLHDAKGIIKEAQERAAALYGSKRSYYLINGSTCGILAAISAAVPKKGRLLMARNAHKSVYHSVYLREISTVYLYPRITGFGIPGAIDPQEVEDHLKKDEKIDAVFLTSPTYEGVVSDVFSIAEIAHRYGVPLIVDEAHGAHFGLHPAFPQTSVRLNADIAIQSMHKVLPALTQTALLHLNSSYISPKTVEKYLEIYETSSPSYILMASMEHCIRLIKEKKEELFAAYLNKLEHFYTKTEKLLGICLMAKADFTQNEIYDLDRSKILISVKSKELDGNKLYGLLLHAYHIQMELYSKNYVLGMTSIMDREEGFQRLYQALKEISANLSFSENANGQDIYFLQDFYRKKEKKMELYEAMELPQKEIPLGQAAGKISAAAVSIYPPGIPALLPGEVIDEEFISKIWKCIQYRLNLQGISDQINGRISVVN